MIVKVKFKYGFDKGYKEFSINDENIIMEVRQNKVNIELTGSAEVRRAIENPVGSKRLREIVKPGEKVAIITSDITRPMPSQVVVPLVIEELLHYFLP
jgi:nickel-dependent lactate racemase